jgi:uncharacterized protein (TIGR00369 family)
MNAAQLPQVDPTLRADLRAGIESMPVCQWLGGVKVIGFLPQGISRIELPVRPALTFEGTVVQAGIVGMLADFAGVSAAASTLPAGWMASTTGFEVHNVAPATGERLVAIGYAQHVGKSLAVSRAEVYAITGEAATLVCLATTTCKPFEFARALPKI